MFGTPNPRVRAWEGWSPANPIDVVDHQGRELRILDVEGIEAGLRAARFEVEAWYGDRSRGPLTRDSDNIVVVATVA